MQAHSSQNSGSSSSSSSCLFQLFFVTKNEDTRLQEEAWQEQSTLNSNIQRHQLKTWRTPINLACDLITCSLVFLDFDFSSFWRDINNTINLLPFDSPIDFLYWFTRRYSTTSCFLLTAAVVVPPVYVILEDIQVNIVLCCSQLIHRLEQWQWWQLFFLLYTHWRWWRTRFRFDVEVGKKSSLDCFSVSLLHHHLTDSIDQLSWLDWLLFYWLSWMHQCFILHLAFECRDVSHLFRHVNIQEHHCHDHHHLPYEFNKKLNNNKHMTECQLSNVDDVPELSIILLSITCQKGSLAVKVVRMSTSVLQSTSLESAGQSVFWNIIHSLGRWVLGMMKKRGDPHIKWYGSITRSAGLAFQFLFLSFLSNSYSHTRETEARCVCVCIIQVKKKMMIMFMASLMMMLLSIKDVSTRTAQETEEKTS